MKDRLGFTIVEVIVVIVAIAILASVGAVTYTGLQRQARADERIADMEVMASYLETYHEEKGNYPSLRTFYMSAEGSQNNTFVQKFDVPRSALIDPSHRDATGPHYSYLGPGITESQILQAPTWPAAGVYTFLPYTSSGAICATPNDNWAPQETNPCTRYTLFHKDDNGTLQELKSKYGN